MDLTDFSPLLASEAELDEIKWPVYGSPKFDGIRAVVLHNEIFSRELKPIPNLYIRNCIKKYGEALNLLDGELVVGSPTNKDVFQVSTSGVMTEEGKPDFCYYVFDYITDLPFRLRNHAVILTVTAYEKVFPIKYVPQTLIHNRDEFNAWEERFVNEGYEGIMLRSVDGIYKFGRSSTKQGILLKYKRFTDTEAVITGFNERMHNGNEATKDAFGHTKRSSHKANKTPLNTLGSFIVRNAEFGEFKVGLGEGMDDAFRKYVWEHKSEFLNKTMKLKYQGKGVKDKPRFPGYVGIRHPDDM